MSAPLHERLRRVASTLDQQFLGKDEVIRLLLIAVVAGEHCVLVGPPGTAKSALIRSLAELLEAKYFEYLLTRFTEPNEIFGPVDIAAFREGNYRRNTAGMLPEAEIVFLDEVFKANSAILNALLTLLNERKYTSGGQILRCPLRSVFAASNEVPSDETLTAVFDRFLLRVHSENLDAYHFNELLQRGVAFEVRQMEQRVQTPIVAARELAELGRSFGERMAFSDAFLTAYKGLVFQIRAEGVSLSDRRVVKLLKLFAASAYLDGREIVNPDTGEQRKPRNTTELHTCMKAIYNPVMLTVNGKSRVIAGTTTDLTDTEFLGKYLEQIIADHSSPPYLIEFISYQDWKELHRANAWINFKQTYKQ